MTGEELRTLIAAHMEHRKPRNDGGRIATWRDLDCWAREAYDELARCLTLHDEE